MLVGVIPARGGSKGVPRKNLAAVSGRPLIYWSIEAAKNARRLDSFFVSTDDEEIEDYCKGLGAEVIRRPSELGADSSRTIDVLHYHHEESFCQNVDFCTLQPTSPIRSAELIDNCALLFYKHTPLILATGYECYHQEFGSNNNLPRQEIKSFFYDDGNIYIHSKRAIIQKMWSCKSAYRFYNDPISSFEIDTVLDLEIVDFLMSKSQR